MTVLLSSLVFTNPDSDFNIYIMSKDLVEDDLQIIYRNIKHNSYHITLIKFDDRMLKGAPISKRYPLEIYYRIFAAKVLPASIDKILYLDPDIVIINKIDELYNLNLGDNLFIGATHVRSFLRKVNQIRLKAKPHVPYINTGVILMNLTLLRRDLNEEDVYRFIKRNKYKLQLPDQDIIFALYGERIKLVDHLKYNLSDRSLTVYNISHKKKLDLAWVKANTAIIHYLGRNKPWKKRYRGILNIFYDQYQKNIE